MRRTSPAARPRWQDFTEPLILLAVPAVLLVCVFVEAVPAAALMLLVALAALALFAVGFERTRPSLRQLMPTATLGALAAAGRVLFAPVPYLKPVSAIVIVSGATLGRRSGFMVGALAALVSNAFFGQGPWTPWQMYAWGLVGYLSGVFVQTGLLPQPGDELANANKSAACRAIPYAWGILSALLYGAILNGWHVIGFVRPLSWPGVLAGYAAGIPFDIFHGVATAGFLLLVWGPWGRAIARVVAKYGLRERA